jgi:hypothetical protein
MIRSFFIAILFFIRHLPSVEFTLFTEPKTGTHLLIPILTELTGKPVYWAKEYTKNGEEIEESYIEAFQNPNYLFFSLTPKPWNKSTMDEVWEANSKKGTFLHLHAPYTVAMESYLRTKNCINFFIKRDPRDQIISLLNHYKYIHCNDKEAGLIASDDERLLYMIRKDLRLHTLHYMGWISSPVCCVLDFSKLMGSHGGVAGDFDALKEMRKIAQALKLPLPNRELKEVYQKHFGKGWNFFKGKVGVWQEYCSQEHKVAMKQEIGDLLIELGYEKNLDW